MKLEIMTNKAYKFIVVTPLITVFQTLCADPDPGMFDTAINTFATTPGVPAKLLFDIKQPPPFYEELQLFPVRQFAGVNYSKFPRLIN